ncbi:type I methionyl aminopeptidase [Buchnera aphidicola]|uniref:type I methionyl aminopeptidase n=1 Tax=Buchnera aphidicola TaxID=9 RepID=UPI003464909A
MKISIKNSEEIKKMRISGKLASQVLEMITPYVVAGITTEHLDYICHNYIVEKQNAIPACLGYQGFPKSTCISVNEVVCHGIPNNTELKHGDIVNIDVTIIKNQYHADTSKMFIVGNTNSIAKKLCYTAKKILYETFSVIKPNIPINIIGKTIQKNIHKTPFSIVTEYCGHGIGKEFHEDPYILHYFNKNNKILFKEGMVFTIEPIINSGKSDVICMDDSWTIKTKDNSLSAQYEHTILVTKNGCEILTKRKTENIKNIYINM